ncbi:MAG: hypothetical protein LIO85_06805 [Rikenellaceae bacterium]|nr:hypothetical protein [Rikenellaceae bacterium]
MEIIDNKKRPDENPVRREKNLYIGGAIVICGLVWLMYNFDVVGSVFFHRFFSWQVFLMALGGYFIALRKWIVGGAVLITGMALAAMDWYDLYIPVKQVLLPMLLIAVGVAVILQNKY